MSRIFDFSYEGLTRDTPYEAIFVDYQHSDFNFMVKKTGSGYAVTCCFREFTLDTETLTLSPAGRLLTEDESALAHVFIREQNEYMNSNEFRVAMDQYQIDMKKECDEQQNARAPGATSPRLFVHASENESKNPNEKAPPKNNPFS